MPAAARRRRTPRSPVAIGLIALAVLAVLVFLGFTKHIPFTHGFILKAQFESANSIRPNSPVRIAGVNVGKVSSVDALQGTNAAVVTMEISKSGLPIHRDATAKIRPRIFLEGNFFVDLQPGSPGAPTLHSGDTIEVTQTASPVQLDEVLTSLQSDSRGDLQALLDGLSTGLNAKPPGGQSAAQSLNRAYDTIPAAERSTAQVFQALLGTEPGRDVARLVRGSAATSAALIRNEGQLQDLITNFNTTVAALASESGNLRASVRELAPTLATADATLSSLNRAFPPTRAFAREILPGVRETAPTIDAAFPWIAQTRKLVSKQELGGLAEQLSPATRDLAQLINAGETLLPQVDATARCVRDKVLPTGDVVIRDEFTTGKPNYKEFWYALAGLAGEGQNFDGNGAYVRFQTGGGPHTVTLGSKSASIGQLFGNNVAVPLGNRPFYPGKRPPYRPDVPCTSNKLPDLNGPAAAKSAPGGSVAAAHADTLAAVRQKLHPFHTPAEAAP
jgi:phospholipid/cholesterol/gamma-HCH transport system substrate-binding protein